MWVSEFYPKENFNDRKTALGIPEILYKVIYSRPRVARTAAASSATSGREQHESRPRVADFFLAWRMTRSEYSQRFRAYLRWIFSRVCRHNIRPPHFASKVSYSASPQAFAECSRSASCRCTASAMLLGQKPCRVFSWILNSLPFRALLFVLCSFIMCALLRHLLFGQKSCRIFQEFEHPGPRLADFPRSL